MFCIYCGATVEEGMKACPNCGSEILVLEPPKKLTPEELVPEETIQIAVLNGEEQAENGRDIYSSAPHRFREEPEMEDISSGRQMELPADEYNIASSDHDPQNITYNDGYAYEEYAEYEEEEPKKKRVWPWVVAIVAAVLVLLGIGVAVFMWYISPAQKFNRAMEASDYTAITDILPKLDEEELREVQPTLNGLAAGMLSRYNNGELDHRTVNIFVGELAETYPGSKEMQAVKSELEALKASKDAFLAAVDAEKIGDKVEALRLLQLVVDSDTNYATAQEHIAAIHSEYKSEIIKEAQALAAEKDFEGAYALLQESGAVLGEDEEIAEVLASLGEAEKENYIVELLETAQKLANEKDFIGAVQVLQGSAQEDGRITERIESYKGQYREEFLTEAETYVRVGDYEEAILTLEGAKDFLGEDEQITEKIKEYKELLPAMLIDLPYTGGTDCSKVEAVTGTNGSTYANGLCFELHPASAETVATEYTPDGKYKRFSGTWVVGSETTNGFIGKIRIYLDDALQYELSSLTVNSSEREMNLLIDGAKEIRIEAEGAFTGEEEAGIIYLAGAVFRN